MFEHYKEARTFRRLMDQPCDTFGATAAVLQARLISEEYEEFLEAHTESLVYMQNKRSREATLKELADLVYVAYQYAAAAGWDLDEALSRIHMSNLTKLDDNLRPVKREDGKVIKGPNYKKASLIDLV